MLDTADLSLEEYVFASRTRKTAGTIDDLAPSAFASTAWFNGLKLLAGKDTDYGLAKHLFPDANSDEMRSHLKTLRSYRDGHRSPREAKIAAFEKLVPGSREFIDMPCWEGLRATATTARRVELMLKLAPEVRRVARRNGRAGNGFAVLSLTAIRSMTRLASADALASLTLLMLEAIKGEDKRHAFELSTAVCEVLLLLAPWLKVLGLLRPVGDYYEQHLLPLAEFDGQRNSFEGRFVESASALVIDGFFVAASRFDDNKVRSPREVIDSRLAAFSSPIARGRPFFRAISTLG